MSRVCDTRRVLEKKEGLPGLVLRTDDRLPTTVAVHCLNLRDQTPVKQPPRKYHPMVVDTIDREVDDQRGLAELQYATWLANLVPVKKRNGKRKICVDYRDFNKARPKDDFSLPNMDILTHRQGFEKFEFIDCYSGYNQIRMAPVELEELRKQLEELL